MRQSFTYNFTAKLADTHWYHAHIGAQKTAGQFGALVVRDCKEMVEETDGEFIVSLVDWFPFSADRYTVGGDVFQNGIQNKPYSFSDSTSVDRAQRAVSHGPA